MDGSEKAIDIGYLTRQRGKNHDVIWHLSFECAQQLLNDNIGKQSEPGSATEAIALASLKIGHCCNHIFHLIRAYLIV